MGFSHRSSRQHDLGRAGDWKRHGALRLAAWRRFAVRNFDWQVVADGKCWPSLAVGSWKPARLCEPCKPWQLTDRCQVGNAAPALTFFFSTASRPTLVCSAPKNQSSTRKT